MGVDVDVDPSWSGWERREVKGVREAREER